MNRLIVTAAAALLATSAWTNAPSAQSSTAQDRLGTIVQQMIARGRDTGAPPASDPAALLAQLRAIDATQLSPDAQIDRRFAQTLLVGRQLAAERRDGPMGEAAYTRMLREQYLLPYDAAALWTYAQTEFDATVAQLDALAKKIDPDKTWQQIANEVKADHPDAMKMIEAHQQVVDRARAHIVAKDLMPLPWPERCTVVARKPGPGNNPYYDSFSGGLVGPPGAGGTLLGEWQINPFDPSWDEAKQKDY